MTPVGYKTVQGYYDSYVHSILNTVVSSLYADKKNYDLYGQNMVRDVVNTATEVQKKQSEAYCFYGTTGRVCWRWLEPK